MIENLVSDNAYMSKLFRPSTSKWYNYRSLIFPLTLQFEKIWNL
ncbi:MAG: hypothetical protein V3V31_11675 [Methylococcales bacterium]